MVAKNLLGKFLVKNMENKKLVVKIVETEAYLGEIDPASHAYKGKSIRNKIMYEEGGILYIYLIYGKYYCLNIVTERKGKPASVFIRAVEPISGIEEMIKLRKVEDIHKLTNGPGKLCQALGITKEDNGLDISKNLIYITEGRREALEIVKSSRVGIKEGRENLWRFYIKDNPFVSKR
jgi:DNA-3-methyladenine glycosylase